MWDARLFAEMSAIVTIETIINIASVMLQDREIAATHCFYTIWNIWKGKNAQVFEGSFFNPQEVVFKASIEAFEFANAMVSHPSPVIQDGALSEVVNFICSFLSWAYQIESECKNVIDFCLGNDSDWQLNAILHLPLASIPP
ncbi:uncharacterized protein G2W53_003975 [Senna tora]|uniref:Uncharacterized protein n=1 Tax=Senna tora TaxID=362788 RepID=A0A834XBI9_9FABA|nr:uncharacterized protein G2W53_003975 [Senna tora]